MTYYSRFLRNSIVVVVFLNVCISGLTQPGVPRQVPPEEETMPIPNLNEFIPKSAKLIKDLTVDFRGMGKDIGIVLAYGTENDHAVTTGVRVLTHGVKGWAIAFEESANFFNGAGASDAINIEKLKSATGKEGVAVILKNSGAGTLTAWYLLASAKNRIVVLEPGKILKTPSYVFEDYADVAVNGDLIVEEIPGYSPASARCCPDEPTRQLKYRFTGFRSKLTR